MLWRALLATVAISYILCVLLLSGLQKEDLDVNTLKKLEQHNVNIHDMNNESLRQECIGKSESNTIITSVQPFETFVEQSAMKQTTTDKGLSDIHEKPITEHPMPVNYILDARNLEQDNKQELVIEQYSSLKQMNPLNASDIINAMDDKNIQTSYHENKPAINKPLFSLWKESKNYSSLSFSSPKISTNFNRLVDISNAAYINSILEQYLNYNNRTLKRQNTSTERDNNKFNFSKSIEFPKFISQVQQESNNKFGNKNPLPLSFNVENQRNLQFKQFETYEVSEQYKESPVLANETNHDESDGNLAKSISSQTQSNKKGLNDLPLLKTNSQLLKRLKSLLSSESKTDKFSDKFPDTGISNISQKENNKYHNEINNNVSTSITEQQKNKNNNNLIEINNGKLEEWYSQLFRNNVESLTMNPHNSQNENLIQPSFDINRGVNKIEKSKNSPYLEHKSNPQYPNINNSNISLSMTEVETDNDSLDFNTFLNSYGDNIMDTSKKLPYSQFKKESETLNSEYFSNITPVSRSNDEDYFPFYNYNQLNKLSFERSTDNSYIRNKTKVEDISRKNEQVNNLYLSGVNAYTNIEHNQSVRSGDLQFLGIKSPPDKFISRFYRNNVAKTINNLFQTHNNEFIATQTEAPERYTFINEQIPDSNIIQETEKKSFLGVNFPDKLSHEIIESSKNIPPFLEYIYKPRESNFNINQKPTTPPLHHNREDSNEISIIKRKPLGKEDKKIKTSQTEQHEGTLDSNVLLKEENLKLIMNSLQNINQILAKNGIFKTPTLPNSSYNDIKKIQSFKSTSIQQGINKKTTKTQPKQNNNTNIQKIRNIQEDFIKTIAESVKKIILKDLKEKTSTPETPTFKPTVTTTTPTLITTDIATTVYQERNTKNASYVIQKIMELFQELKSNSEIYETSSLPLQLFESYVTDYSKNSSVPLASVPAMNLYGIKNEGMEKSDSQIINTTLLHPNSLQISGNYYKNENKDSWQTQILNQPQQIPKRPSHRRINIQPHMTNQQKHISNQIQRTLNRSPQKINNVPQINYLSQQMLNHGPQMSNKNIEILNQLPQMANQAVEIINLPPLIPNQDLRNIYLTPKILNHEAQTSNQRSQILNRQSANLEMQQFIRTPVLLNQSQFKKDAHDSSKESIYINHSPQNQNHVQNVTQGETLNQSPQILNQFPHKFNQYRQNLNRVQEMLNQALQMRYQEPKLVTRFAETNPPHPISNYHPKILGAQDNSKPSQLTHETVTLNQSTEITHKSKKRRNRFQLPPYITFQTNSEEIPPLGISIDKPKGIVNQIIIVTTKSPIEKLKDERQKWEFKNWLHEKSKEGELKQSDSINELRTSSSRKRYDINKPYKNRSSSFTANQSHSNISESQRLPYKTSYKRPNYKRVRSQHEIKNFHDQLERIEDWTELDRKGSRERDCCEDVASRQQIPLGILKQRSRFDDTHFRNFLKTQEKVNDMLERILAMKSMSERHSVETP